jgi:hypothetical protein
MRYPILLSLSLVGLLLSGCVNPFAPLDRQAYHRLGLVNLYPETIAVDNLNDWLSLPNTQEVQPKGFSMHAFIGQHAEQALEADGFTVGQIPVDPELFWARYEAARKKSPGALGIGSSYSFGDYLKTLCHDGTIDPSKFDLIVVIGPALIGGEGQTRGMMQEGTGVHIVFLKNHLKRFTAFFQVGSCGYDPKLDKGVFGLRNMFATPPLTLTFPDVDTIDTLLDGHHDDALRQLVEPLVTKAFADLVR